MKQPDKLIVFLGHVADKMIGVFTLFMIFYVIYPYPMGIEPFTMPNWVWEWLRVVLAFTYVGVLLITFGYKMAKTKGE